MHYLYLIVAIVTEVVATTALKTSESFTRPIPSLIVVFGYALSFYLLSLCLQTMKIGLVYAIWSGVGIVLISVVGAILFRQRLDMASLLGIGLIVAGVFVINLFSTVKAH